MLPIFKLKVTGESEKEKKRKNSSSEHFGLKMDRNVVVDGLLNLFSRSSRDLSVVHNKLEKEFEQVYPDHANPMKLVARLKRVEDEMSGLKDKCRELLAAKQELIDAARMLLVGNRTLLQRLQASTGVPVTSEADDPAYASFNQVIDEWTTHVKSRPEMEAEPGSDDINQMLFSAIIPSN